MKKKINKEDKGKQDEESKKKAIWVLILFLLVLVGSIYVALFGVGDRGKAKYISLGLDLKGGLSVTYEIQDEDYSDADVQDTIYKLQKRIDSHTTEHNVYSEGMVRSLPKFRV